MRGRHPGSDGLRLGGYRHLVAQAARGAHGVREAVVVSRRGLHHRAAEHHGDIGSERQDGRGTTVVAEYQVDRPARVDRTAEDQIERAHSGSMSEQLIVTRPPTYICMLGTGWPSLTITWAPLPGKPADMSMTATPAPSTNLAQTGRPDTATLASSVQVRIA